MNRLRQILRDQRGAAMTEYIILIGIVALIAYGGFQLFGQDVRQEIETQGTSVGSINNSLGGNH